MLLDLFMDFFYLRELGVVIREVYTLGRGQDIFFSTVMHAHEPIVFAKLTCCSVRAMGSVIVALFLYLRFSFVLYNPLHVLSQDGLLEIGPKVLFCMQDHIISTNRNIIISTLYYFML